MVKRLDNLSSWKEWKAGDALLVGGFSAHKVVLDVNTETDAAFVVIMPAGDSEAIVPLGTVCGMDRFQFTAPVGAEVRVTSEGAVWFFTDEGDHITFEALGQSFVRLATRRERNPQLEMMLFKQDQNAKRRETAMAAEVAAFRAERAAWAQSMGANTETGEVEDEPVVDDKAAASPAREPVEQPAAQPAAASPKKGVRANGAAAG